jgi:hypothetical protein
MLLSPVLRCGPYRLVHPSSNRQTIMSLNVGIIHLTVSRSQRIQFEKETATLISKNSGVRVRRNRRGSRLAGEPDGLLCSCSGPRSTHSSAGSSAAGGRGFSRDSLIVLRTSIMGYLEPTSRPSPMLLWNIEAAPKRQSYRGGGGTFRRAGAGAEATITPPGGLSTETGVNPLHLPHP